MIQRFMIWRWMMVFSLLAACLVLKTTARASNLETNFDAKLQAKLATELVTNKVHLDGVRDLLAKAPAVDGTGVILSENLLAKGKPMVVTFFASWCPPCTQEFKHLNEMRDKLPAGILTIIGINAFENFGTKRNPARMKRFLKRTKPMFPLVVGDEALLKAFGDVTRIPTVIVFDKTGKEVWRFVHVQGSDKRFSTTQEISAALEMATK